jgi:hypothetical protein
VNNLPGDPGLPPGVSAEDVDTGGRGYPRCRCGRLLKLNDDDEPESDTCPRCSDPDYFREERNI